MNNGKALDKEKPANEKRQQNTHYIGRKRYGYYIACVFYFCHSEVDCRYIKGGFGRPHHNASKPSNERVGTVFL